MEPLACEQSAHSFHCNELSEAAKSSHGQFCLREDLLERDLKQESLNMDANSHSIDLVELNYQNHKSICENSSQLNASVSTYAGSEHFNQLPTAQNTPEALKFTHTYKEKALAALQPKQSHEIKLAKITQQLIEVQKELSNLKQSTLPAVSGSQRVEKL